MDRAGEKHQTNARPADGEPYELWDFGAGRRLERLGGVWVDRPSPAAARWQPSAQPWPAQRVRFERETAQRGQWTIPADLPLSSRWTTQIAGIRFLLRTTPSGQVGVFPEQAANWTWLREQLSQPADAPPPRLLNLFAYTGGSTLAAAAAGAEVTHVDAADSVVKWARENLALAELAQPTVRWIVDDVRKFVGREQRRDRQYDAIVLDPPSYGHGQRGEAWRLERDLPGLLAACRAILSSAPRLILLTCHPPDWTAADLRNLACPSFAGLPLKWTCGELALTDRAGRRLPSGLFLRGVSTAS